MRWGAPGVLTAALAEGLPGTDDPALAAWVDRAHADPGLLPTDDLGRDLDLRLATLAALVAARRHGRPGAPGEAPRPLKEVGLLLGSGGVLRHAAPDEAGAVLRAVLTDHGGGWTPPAQAEARVDTAYLLFAVGLLAASRPDLARAVAGQLGRNPDGAGPGSLG